MGKSLFILLIVFPFILFGQKTRKIVRERVFPELSEVYYVLKSDTTVKHGSYQAGTLGKVLLEGFFKMGYRDSLWIQQSMEGKMRSIGWYKQNRRDSIWEFYDRKGELEQKFDLSNNQVLQYKTNFANHIFKIFTGGDTILSKLERPPLFFGGSSWLADYVEEELSIPLHKEGEKVTGVVYVSFMIDSLGATSHHRILKGIGKACNNEALRVIKSIPDDWLPGVYDGHFVSVEYTVILVFDDKTRPMEP